MTKTFIPYTLFFCLIMLAADPCTLLAKPLLALLQIAEHPALNATRQGLLQELELQGFDHDHLSVMYQNAQGNLTTATQIAQHLTSQKPTLFIALATPAAQAAQRPCRQHAIPLLFASVTDPIGSRLIESPPALHVGITGVSNYIAVEEQLRYFQELVPSLKTVGYVYNPSESNSHHLINKTEEAAQALGLKIIPSPAYRTSDVATATHNLIGKVDALFVNNDNTALAAFDTIAKISQEKKLPLFCSDTDLVAHKAFAALGCNQYQLGRQVGRMAASILRGAEPHDLPIETSKVVEKHLNITLLRSLGLPLPSPDSLSSMIVHETRTTP